MVPTSAVGIQPSFEAAFKYLTYVGNGGSGASHGGVKSGSVML